MPTDTRIPCSVCGMVANVDPWLHEERYGHSPSIRVDGLVLVHQGDGTFAAEAPFPCPQCGTEVLPTDLMCGRCEADEIRAELDWLDER